MSGEFSQTLQVYVLIPAILGEVILLVTLFKRFANQRIQRIRANVALSLVALSLTIIFGGNTFGIFPEHVDALKNFAHPITNFTHASIASAPNDIQEELNGSVINAIPLAIGMLTLSAIFLLVMVTLREYLARKKQNDEMEHFKRKMDGYK